MATSTATVDAQQHLDFRGYSYLLQHLDQLLLTKTFDGHDCRDGMSNYVSTYYKETLLRKGDEVTIKVSRAAGSGRSGLIVLTQELSGTRNGSDDVTAKTDLPSIPENEDVVHFVLKKIAQAARKGLPSIPFIDHVGYHAALLRACHNNTCDEEYKMATQRFTTYAFLSGLSKATERYEFGKSRNYDALVSYRTENITPKHFHAHKVPGRPPTKRQSRFMLEFYESMLPSDMQDCAKRYSQDPLFCSHSRERFQIILTAVVSSVTGCIKKLNEHLTMGTKDAETWYQEVAGQGKQIQELVDKLEQSARNLGIFICAFHIDVGKNGPLLAHLEWLYRVSGVTSHHDHVFFKDSLQNNSSEAASSKDQERNDTTDQESSSSDESDDAPLEIGCRRSKVAPTKWAQAVIHWMEDLVLLSGNISGATSRHFRDKEKILFQSSLVAVVNTYPAERNGSRTSISDCFDKLLLRNPAVAKVLDKAELMEKLNKYFRHLSRGAFVHNTKFKDAVHCESVLLSQLAAANGKSSTLSQLQNSALPLVTLARRCCPSCWYLAQILLKRGKLGKLAVLRNPGYQTKWSPVSLPSCLPNDIMEECLDRAMDKAMQKLQTLQRSINQYKKDEAKQREIEYRLGSTVKSQMLRNASMSRIKKAAAKVDEAEMERKEADQGEKSEAQSKKGRRDTRMGI